MNKCKIGVVGIGRGSMMWKYCKSADNGEIVAVCDKRKTGLDSIKKELNDENISYYTDFDEFLKHDMDLVLLANYATEHAPFAIKAMEAGKNVISEVLPAQTLSQAVALIECVERTGQIYCYAENYCFMNAPREMKKKFRDGLLGEFEYGEGEYMHNCEPIWTDITCGDKTHWRNNMSAFYYCTHSIGPLLHITGLRPIAVNGFEGMFNPRMARMGAKAGAMGIEIITLENGAIIKSIHGVGCSKNSIWYSVYGAKGRMESAREDSNSGEFNHIYTNLDKTEGVTENSIESYDPTDALAEESAKHGHGGSDYYCLHNAIDYVMGDKTADVINVYEAVDMWLPGFFGFISAMNGNSKEEIPDLRKKNVRDKFRNDNRCTDPAVAKEQLIPSYSKGKLIIPDAIYDRRREEWENKNGKGKDDYGMNKED